MSMQNKSLIFAALLSLAMFCCARARAVERHSLRGHVPEVIQNLPSTGTLQSSAQLDLVIGLPLRNTQMLSNLLQQIYSPSSPQYRQYLTPDQFTEMFGPTEQEYQNVIAFAKANNLIVRGVHENRMLVDVSGAASDIQQAFHIELKTYQHPKESRSFYAPSSEPSVEANVPVLDVSGLDNFDLPHPGNRRTMSFRPVGNARSKSGSGPGGAFIGSDFRQSYFPGLTLTGAGQSVGLLEFDGFYPSDISAYESQAGLPNVPLKIVLLDGFKGIPSRGTSGNSEVALDIDMAISMAPGLSQVVVYEAGPNGFANDVLSAMSTNTSVKQFSCSWTFGSTPRNTMDQLFQKLAAQGQAFFDASGDSGADSGAIGEPDDDPYVTSVGGTTLSTSRSGGAWISETVWNAGDGTNSSSGGISKTYAIPTWQQGISMSANHGSTTFRNIPDVAMTADNVFIVADNGVQQVSGGTSAAAPLWAGLIALVNQEAAANGLPSVGFVNPAIYAIGKSGGYLAAFDDITTGNNTNSNTDQFQAVPGYDLCTGWGSPAGSSLIHALARPDNLTIIPGRGFVANGPVGGPFNPSIQTMVLTNSGTATFNWKLSASPSWLSVSQSGGTLVPGQPATPLTLELNSGASQMGAGVYEAILWFTNVTSGLAQSRQITLMVAQEIVQDGGFEAGDFAYWALVGSDAALNSFVDDGSTTSLTPRFGPYFALLGQTNTIAYLGQNLPTRPWQPYLLSFWLQSADIGNGTVPNEFEVKWGTNSILDELDLPSFDWTNFQFAVQATKASTALQFGFRNDPSYFGLDDISVTPIPLPVLRIINAASGAITFSWDTLSGLSYQLQYTTSLTSSDWLNSGDVITATSSSATASDTITDRQRFYRVVLLP